MKSTLKLLAAVAVLTPLATAAQAQFEVGRRPGGDQGGSQKPAWEEFRLDSKKRIQLSFRNASVDQIVDILSKTSGITIVSDPALSQRMTVTSPRAVPLKDAFAIFNTALGLRGFELGKEGNIMVIRRRQERNTMGADAMRAMMAGAQQSQSELKVYRIKYASASEVARVVNEVFIQQQQMQGGFPGMNFGGFGGGGGRFGGGRPGMGGVPFSFPGLGGQQPNVRASSDDFSNSVIVNAPKDKQLEVESLIEDIDKQTDQPFQTKTYRLKFATALEMQPVIQGVLQSNAPRGRGGPSNQSVNQRFSFFDLFSGGNRQGQGSVNSDDRSNSLIVTTTADNQTVVESLIKELDQEVPVVNTTFVFPLRNARADSVATLLQNAFGNRNGGSGFSNRGGGFNNQGNRTQGNRNQGNRNFGGGGGGGRTAPEAGQPVDVPLDEKADDGVLMTDVWVQQGGFRFGGGQQTRQQSGLVRGADGQVVNQRDLTNQVTVIPDPNTNSLVIVTTPDNVEVLRSVLDQLDRIPEQVMIETMIVEATLDKSTKLGVEWTVAQPKAFNETGVTGNARSDFGLANANPALEGFRYTVTGGNISTFINALKTDDKFEVLSTPRIFTSNNVEAEINISQSVPYVLSTREDANGNLTFNYAFQDVGIVLTVTPRITSNGYVTMEISQTANDLQGFTDFNAPIVNQRQANTTVSVKDSETIILGGIIRTQVNSKVKKLPILGDIPILGELFKSTTRQNTKTELLVFLRPTIVRDDEEAKALRESTEKQLSQGLLDKVQKNRVNTGTSPASTKQDKGNKVTPPATQGDKSGDKTNP
jgi:general secretion pathway protein D